MMVAFRHKSRRARRCAAGLLALGFAPFVWAESALDIEAALVMTGYNNVAVPGNGGTRFSLADELDADNTVAYRIRYGHRIDERHWIGLLAAPLTVESRGQLSQPVDFQGGRFAAGEPTWASFRFDSYRFIYRYTLIDKDTTRFEFGGALKLRDAAIEMRNASTRAKKDNTGFVPLLSLSWRWWLNGRTEMLVDGEALAAPQGRAEDILFAVRHRLNEQAAVYAGYRILEGGADNDEVYTFSLFHQITLGLTWTFSAGR